jgi:hypothetical protein
MAFNTGGMFEDYRRPTGSVILCQTIDGYVHFEYILDEMVTQGR